jgi:geranylgeranyl pyrophosphate synthase
LSGFCCQAAGGNPEIAGPLVAAWYLFNRAAHIMDSVQDQDEPEEWWADAGPGVALSAASGLFFTASKILSGLETYGIDPGPAGLVRQTFSGTLLKMSAGQYDDLVTEVPTLEQYWRLIELKSGIFFSLASRAGAQLALQDPARLDAFETFGLEIGLLVQILDDLEDYQVDESMQLPLLMNSDSRRSLPVVYALNMYPPATRQLLLQDLQQAKEDRQSAQEAWDLIEACGAGLYVKMEIENHHQKALQALDLAQPLPPARQELIDLLNELVA